MRWHCAIAVTLGAGGLLATALLMKVSAPLALTALTLAVIGTSSAIPVFWQMPNRILTGAAAAVGVAVINSIANLAGFGAPFMLGAVKTATGLLSPGLLVISAIEIVAAILIIKFILRMHRAAKA